MNLLKVYSFLFIITALVLFSGKTLAEGEKDVVHKSIRIGVPGNRYPYSYIDAESEIRGLLINRVTDICARSNLECHFVDRNFHENLEELRLMNIDAALVVDSIILPKNDEVRVTLPLCKYSSVFIKKVRLSLQKTVSDDDLKNQTIGVTSGSVFHLYAIDNYYGFSNIKPYETLEAGVFDLFSEKIDFLFTETAFYEARVGSTLLGNRHNGFWLKPLGSESVVLPDTLMTLMIRNTDDELWNMMALTMTKQDAERSCSALLSEVETDNEKPANDTNPVKSD